MAKNINVIKMDLDGDKTLLNVLQKDVVDYKDAEKYNINLDSLEDVLRDEQKSKSSDWQNLDIQIKDIINSFIATSDRPVFLVRDDKIVYINQAVLEFFDIAFDKDIIGSNGSTLLPLLQLRPIGYTMGIRYLHIARDL
jgi:PAS domain-containing protein